MAMHPIYVPLPPMPAMTFPTIKAFIVGAEALIAEPTAYNTRATRNVHFLFERVYNFPLCRSQRLQYMTHTISSAAVAGLTTVDKYSNFLTGMSR